MKSFHLLIETIFLTGIPYVFLYEIPCVPEFLLQNFTKIHESTDLKVHTFKSQGGAPYFAEMLASQLVWCVHMLYSPGFVVMNYLLDGVTNITRRIPTLTIINHY